VIPDAAGAGAAEAMYESVGAPLEPWERSLRDRYVARIGGGHERTWAEGHEVTLDEAVAEATGHLADL
jgi:hypothetical protein